MAYDLDVAVLRRYIAIEIYFQGIAHEVADAHVFFRLNII
jgi:hypothetical protein